MKISWLECAVDLRPPYEVRLRLAWPLKGLAAFRSLLLFIAAVSVHDAALVVLHHDLILEVERNPIGRWLIEANNGCVWLFVIVKLFNTSVVCTLLVSIYERSRHVGFVITSALAILQGLLLLYLCTS